MRNIPTYNEAARLYSKYEQFLKRQAVGNYIMYDYRLANWQMFRDDPLTRNFRGITYDTRNGNVVSLPFHKFFNLGENPETTDVMESDWTGNYQTKHDGSMVQIVWYGDELFVASRGSMTGYVNEAVTEFLHSDEELYDAMKYATMMNVNWTLLFEWQNSNPEHTVVIPHMKSELVFLNARNKLTGGYCHEETLNNFDHSALHALLAEDGTDIALLKNTSASELPRLMDEAEANQQEGYVFWVDNYGPVKMKAKWYVEAHGTVTDTRPQDWVRQWANDELDDLLAVLTQLGHNHRTYAVREFIAKALHPELTGQVLLAEAAYKGLENPTTKDVAITLKERLHDGLVAHMVFSASMRVYRELGKIDRDEVFFAVKEKMKDVHTAKKVAKYLGAKDDDDEE